MPEGSDGAPAPLKVVCNAGTVTCNKKGYFRDHPEAVWYNPEGVANILSWHHVSKHCRIRYDNDQSADVVVTLNDGDELRFKPSSRGLYYLDITEDKGNNQQWTLVQTVKEQRSKYTRRAQIKANLARKIQNIIGRPGTRQFMDIASKNLLPHCPVTRSDIAAAEDIYGSNLGSLRGKTVSRPNEHVTTGIDGVPPEIMTLYHDVTLAIDIMFVNKIPFLDFVSKCALTA